MNRQEETNVWLTMNAEEDINNRSILSMEKAREAIKIERGVMISKAVVAFQESDGDIKKFIELINK